MKHYNHETINLLNQLGLTRDGPNKEIYYNFLASYVKLKTNPETLNAELTRMLAVIDKATAKAERLIKDQGLKSISVTTEWDQYYKCYVQTYTLDNKQKIEIRVNNNLSNNNWNPNDIQRMYDSKFAAAITKKNHSLAIQNIKQKYDPELKELQANFYKQPLKAVINKTKNLHQRINQELVKLVPDLQHRENKLLATARRPIIINAYPQTSGWLMQTNIPKSDLPSGVRDYEIKKISNYWSVNITTFKFDKNNNISVHKIRNFFRSASIAQLDVDKPNRPLELEVLQNTIQELACEKIIHDYLKGNDIKSSYTVKFAPTTLLSSLVSKNLGKKISFFVKPLKGTLVEGNEMEQLKSIETALTSLDQNIKLTDKNIHYIISTIVHKISSLNTPREINLLKQQLEKANIKQANHTFNIAVNKLGATPMEKLDLQNYNYKYNSRNNAKLSANMLDFLKENNVKHKDLAFLLSKEITYKNWPDLKTKYQRLQFNTGDDRLNNKLRRLIDNFVHLQDHIQFVPNENSRMANGFLAGLYLFELNQILGFTNHVTCKSGKDRTGLFVMLYEALSAGDQKELLNNLSHALKFSSAKQLNELNAPGCSALQIDNDILEGLKEVYSTKLKTPRQSIKQQLKQMLSRTIGGMHKAVYKKPKENLPDPSKKHQKKSLFLKKH